MASSELESSTVSDAKVCHVCGVNVQGKPRQRDEKGRYWCMPCANAADAEASQAVAERKLKGAQCDDCGRRVVESELLVVEGGKVCPPCQQIRAQEKAKAQARRELAASGGAEERRRQGTRLIVLLIVAAILAVFTLYWNGVIKL